MIERGRARRIAAALVSFTLLTSLAACKGKEGVDALAHGAPLQVELSVAPVVDDHPWVIAFLTELSITRPPGVDARLEGRTDGQGLRHPEPVIEGEVREALADALASYEREHPRSPELQPVWQPEPFGPGERVAWRLYFVDTARGFRVDDQARASLRRDPRGHGHPPSVHLQLGDAQRQRFAALTNEQVGGRIAIVLGDELLMMPVVMEAVVDGDIGLLSNPRQDPELSAPALLERLTRP